MGISLDGLASGLDTTALISSIMQSEAIPQTLLKNKSYDVQTMVSALQGLKRQSRRPRDAGHGRSPSPEPWNCTRGHEQRQGHRHDQVPQPKPGAIDFQVTQLAQTQVTVSPSNVAGWPYTTMTINSGGQAITVTPLTIIS